MHVSEKFAPYLWGGSKQISNIMEHANTRVILVAGDGGWSEGFDNKQDLERLPQNYTGSIWTNRIEYYASYSKKVIKIKE